MDLTEEREALREEIRRNVAAMPEAPPLDLKVLSKSRRSDGWAYYDEWKVEFTIDLPNRMPMAAATKIPAYVLIPDQSKFRPPYPSVVAFHQCNVDCLLGKEAVVGKAVYRPDQAYGVELALQGFLVLAPDTLNCGERHISEVRKEGERKLCHAELERYEKSMPFYPIRGSYEMLRMVDALLSMDMVDRDRIGVIGHSMGVYSCVETMAYDERVKAGIVSGEIGQTRLYPLLSPRLFLALFGSLDKSIDRGRIEGVFNQTRKFYESDGSAENLILRFKNCTHYFHEEFKLEAYSRLKALFGMSTSKKRVPLYDVMDEARNNVSWLWKEEGLSFPESPECSYAIEANREEMVGALEALWIGFNSKRPDDAKFIVEVEDGGEKLRIISSFECDTPEDVDRAKGGYASWLTQQTLFEHSISVGMEQQPGTVRYVVSMPQAS